MGDSYKSSLDFIYYNPIEKKGSYILSPKFIVDKTKHLMIRGGNFYAIWDEEIGLWSTDEYRAMKLIDAETRKAAAFYKEEYGRLQTDYLWDADSGTIEKWNKYTQKQMRDSWHKLDSKIVFHSDPAKIEDYASHRLPYDLSDEPHPAFDEMMSVLYKPTELHKIMWSVGAVLSGNSSKIQKFIVLYGEGGTGKSTVLHIIEKIFEEYTITFDAKSLGSNNGTFALAQFNSNPLVAIQHDGDLSRIEDNTKLNSLISHEEVEVNEKYTKNYSMKFDTFLFIGSNKPVKITDARSGLIRRLIDVRPTGDKIEPTHYDILNNQILKFEIGSIAKTCLECFLADPRYYDHYTPYDMMGSTNHLYDFVLDNLQEFQESEFMTLTRIWDMYKEYKTNAEIQYSRNRQQLKEDMKPFFREYRERTNINGTYFRKVYVGFREDRVIYVEKKEDETIPADRFTFAEGITSELDILAQDFPAQYSNEHGTPEKPWDDVTTTLKDLDTHKEHYVRVPENLIVIDFDIRDESGEKSFAKSLEAANNWPLTYAELSKSGKGIHLHYYYDGDPKELSSLYDDKIEIKVYTGKSSLRRRLTKCNIASIAHLAVGSLPIKKGGSSTLKDYTLKDEQHLRNRISQHLRKEVCPGTKPSIDMIKKCLDDAYDSGMKYDVSDMKIQVITFASKSTNHAAYCLAQSNQMQYKSKEEIEEGEYKKDDLVIFDLEVYPNLLLINWKFVGTPNTSIVRMINPSPESVLKLTEYKLIGYNNRRYDNHILYGRILGYNNEELFRLSQNIINGGKTSDALFGAAYNLSYTDIYDFAAVKQSLKKWEIDLGIHHEEMALPWDEPVPEELWPTVAKYCDNDVIATEAVWNHLQSDFTARKMLTEIAKAKGVDASLNTTTNSLTQKIVFGKEKHPELVFPAIEETFPDYRWERGPDGKMHNMYKDIDLGYGGYVCALPGFYTNVALLDIRSMHPSSIIIMNLFGEFTQNFKEIYDCRQLIKQERYDEAGELLHGVLKPYLGDKTTAKDLSYALKIAINAVYGQTSASYDNPFRDKRNYNNIVALRGALFMASLAEKVREKGFIVAHIKTDSIKIPEATPEIIDFCMKYAEKYGYVFEHEATYDKMCLVNNAVYICYHDGHWEATGKEFAVPYIMKTLFTHEKIEFEDYCIPFEVKKGKLYLDMNTEDEDAHDLQFIGRIGLFVPVKAAYGGILYRVQDDKYYAAAGTKGYYWQEAEKIRDRADIDEIIDKRYWADQAEASKHHIEEFVDFDTFYNT